MKKNLLSINKVLLMSLTLFLVSCGYKPSVHYIKNIFDEKVYVNVEVDMVEPENAPFEKDEMNRLIYTRFKGQVVPKDDAESSIYVSYKGTSFYPLSYENGYVTRYRVMTRANFVMYTKRGTLKKSISTTYEADIHASSFASSALRTRAIKKGLEKALDEFLAYVSVKGALPPKKKKKSKKDKPKDEVAKK
jgi:hypothetical protein